MKPFIVGIGGTVRPGSSSEAALKLALESAEAAGGETMRFDAGQLQLPHYDPTDPDRTPAQEQLIGALRQADGLIIASPAYHGGVSGLIKNALDHTEDLARDGRVYLSDIPVGCIGVAYGTQAAVSTLQNLRTIVHALRGVPTPYGAAIVVTEQNYVNGRFVESGVRGCLELVGTQVAAFAAVLAGLSDGGIAKMLASVTPDFGGPTVICG